MADKDLEITTYQEKIQWLENKLLELQNQLTNIETKYREDLDKINREKKSLVVVSQKNGTLEDKKELSDDKNTCHNVSQLIIYLQYYKNSYF